MNKLNEGNLGNYENYSYLSEDKTMGKYKTIPYFINKRFERIGGISVPLLKEFLRKLPKEKNLVIGVYVCKRDYHNAKKGELAPLHCKSFFLTPRVLRLKSQKKEEKRLEFEKNEK